MNEINISLYGGKSIFGGREKPLEAVITRCDMADKCSFYKDKTCFKLRGFGSRCKYGKNQIVTGYTSRAQKYGKFKSKYTKDENYEKLKRPKSTIGTIGDEYVINLSCLGIDEKGKLDTRYFSSNLIYIKKDELNFEFIKEIVNYRPRSFF